MCYRDQQSQYVNIRSVRKISLLLLVDSYITVGKCREGSKVDHSLSNVSIHFKIALFDSL